MFQTSMSELPCVSVDKEHRTKPIERFLVHYVVDYTDQDLESPLGFLPMFHQFQRKDE
jgi:hypothetical protein